MERDNTLAMALDAMLENGAECAQAGLERAEKCELDVATGEVSLLRSVVNARLTLTAYVGGRKGSITVNRIDRASVESAAAEAASLAKSSEPDPANAISPAQAAATFGFGSRKPDRHSMCDRLEAFLAQSRRRYPRTWLEPCVLDFTKTESSFANTNGAEFRADAGIYGFWVGFTTKDGKKASSFNYSGAFRRQLGEPLEQWGSVEELMRQSTEQLEPGPVEGKFTGDIIVTPDCMDELVRHIDHVFLGDEALIKGTSPFREALGTPVASPLFTLRSSPASAEIQNGYFFTPDGFPAADSTLIDKGTLAAFNLSLYGANKTGKPRAPNSGGCWVIDAGDQGLADLIASVERGILLNRFSGGKPSANGDFSGVAKNSYLIEGGRIARPVSETMLAGNLAGLLRAVSGVSKERVDFGASVYPWVKAGGVTISGK